MRAALQVLRRAPRLRHQSTAAAQKTVDDAFLASLEALATTSQSPDVRKLHGDDESHHEPIPPEVVAFPESTEEVAAILKLCNEQSIAVVPYGAGTSLEGHIQASRGGVCSGFLLPRRRPTGGGALRWRCLLPCCCFVWEQRRRFDNGTECRWRFRLSPG